MSTLDKIFAASEEQRAQVDEEFKGCGEFTLGPIDNHSASDFASVTHMQSAVNKIMTDPGAFYTSDADNPEFSLSDGALTYRSHITDGSANSLVHVQAIKHRPGAEKAIIIVHHWNAKQDDYLRLAKILNWRGYAVFILTLPHHGKRSSSKPDHIANEFLNANISAAINSVRQSVLDVRSLVRWIENKGYKHIDLVGVSLGSSVASLTAAFEPRLSRCALLMTAGDFAETVWTGRATARIRQAFEGHISLSQLQQIWSIISPSHFVEKIAANNLPILLMNCKRDSVVKFKLGEEYGKALSEVGVNLTTHALPCGHYTLGSFPFSGVMVFRLLQFLRR